MRRVARDQALPLAIGVALAAAVITGLIAGWLWSRAHDETDVELANGGEILASSVGDAVTEITERLVAVGGLYQASEEVTQDEFRHFVANFDLNAGMGGIGFMPIVAADELERFIGEMRQSIPGYSVFEMDDAGNRIPVAERREYVPVQWFEPADAFGRPHGFDSASHPSRLRTLERARISGDLAVTPFLELVSEDETDGFLMYWPVSDPATGSVTGYVVAPMDLSELLESRFPAGLRDSVHWEVTDVTDQIRTPEAPADGWAQILDVGGRRWRLAVTAKAGSSLTADPAESLLVLAAGLSASLLAGAGVYLYRQRSLARQELDQLKELTRAKDEFLASVSHELRTPLTGVLGFAELLREGHDDLDDDQRRVMISSVADEATDLAAIIDDLLVAARSELDMLIVTRAAVAPRAQVAQVLEAAGAQTCERVKVVGDADDTYRAVGDPARVRQILRNLISNACRYGGDGIEIRFRRDHDVVRVQVADNGPGVPPREGDRIFEPYHRAHRDGSPPTGVGIGLTVARYLAQLMNGDLTHRREHDWTIFELTLPAATDSWDEPSSTGADRILEPR